MLLLYHVYNNLYGYMISQYDFTIFVVVSCILQKTLKAQSAARDSVYFSRVGNRLSTCYQSALRGTIYGAHYIIYLCVSSQA